MLGERCEFAPKKFPRRSGSKDLFEFSVSEFAVLNPSANPSRIGFESLRDQVIGFASREFPLTVAKMLSRGHGAERVNDFETALPSRSNGDV
jgi:hypothetical protein